MSVTGEVQCPRCLNTFCVTVVNKPEIVIHPNSKTTTGEVVCSLCQYMHAVGSPCPEPERSHKCCGHPPQAHFSGGCMVRVKDRDTVYCPCTIPHSDKQYSERIADQLDEHNG